jgi:hypothetical protein
VLAQEKEAYMKKILFVLIFTLTACVGMTSDPWLKDALTHPKKIDISDENTKLRMRYLGRYLMEGDDRKVLEAQINHTEWVKTWDAVDYGALTSMSTDLAVGKVGSSLGHDLGNAVWVAGMVGGEIFDGSMNSISQAWLPAEYNGQPIETDLEANQVMEQMVVDKIKRIAKTMGWSYECLYGCPGLNHVFLLKRNENAKNPGYIYWPDHIAVSTNLYKMEAVKQMNLITTRI